MSRILLDENLPVGMAALRPSHEVRHVVEQGWDGLSNGRLLAVAEKAGFDVFVTADRNLRHQQNLAGRPLAILVLNTHRWAIIRRRAARVAVALGGLLPGAVVELEL